jgi:hypothetical protein
MLALHTTVSLSTLPTFPDFVLQSNQTGLHFGVANRLVFHISTYKSNQHHINLIIHDNLTSNPCEAYVLIRAPRSVYNTRGREIQFHEIYPAGGDMSSLRATHTQRSRRRVRANFEREPAEVWKHIFRGAVWFLHACSFI